MRRWVLHRLVEKAWRVAGPQIQTLITDDTIDQLTAIPGVVSVVPRDYIQGAAVLKHNRMETYIGIIGVGLTRP